MMKLNFQNFSCALTLIAFSYKYPLDDHFMSMFNFLSSGSSLGIIVYLYVPFI